MAKDLQMPRKEVTYGKIRSAQDNLIYISRGLDSVSVSQSRTWHRRTMAPLSAVQYEHSQTVFDVLEQQISLKEDSLVSLTKAFLEEFNLGLSNYNQAMAMM
jgi:hypothetical protein